MDPANKAQKYTYFNRDVSWLSFNYRVLREAADPQNPLFERIKFLAIYSSNLHEFFRVRVAYLKNLIRLNKRKINKRLGFDPETLLPEVLDIVQAQQNEYGEIFREQILPELLEAGIHLYYREEPLPIHNKAVRNYFLNRVLAYLCPVFLKEGNEIPFLDDHALYFIVVLREKKAPKAGLQYAIVNIPSDILPRFFELEKQDGTWHFMILDDVIRFNMHRIFQGYTVQDCFSIKVTRDADLRIGDEYSGNLVEKVKKQLKRRELGPTSRLLYDRSMEGHCLNVLTKFFMLSANELMPGGYYHNFSDLFALKNPLAPALQLKDWEALPHPEMEKAESLLDLIVENDQVLHFPYQSYDYVLRFFNEAAIDPTVKSLKVTVYRIAANSFIANALMSAARNGKQVEVFVEVKARFDEANNIKWAEALEKAGARIIYSIPGLKVHAKIASIKRMVKGRRQDIAYLGTGNFNESTARIYADHGYFTASKDINQELEKVFRHLRDQSYIPSLKLLLVSQINLENRFDQLISEAIDCAASGQDPSILIKLNNLEEKRMIDRLYDASNAGVKINLIIRGICCLVPGIKGQSENIRITRIVDRYLEHARVFIFRYGGEEKVFMGSADWMNRNIYHRIEVVFPVFGMIKKEILDIIDLQLKACSKSTWIGSQLENIPKEMNEAVQDLTAQGLIRKYLNSLIH